MLGICICDIFLSFTIERDICSCLRSSPHGVDIWQLWFFLDVGGFINIDVNRGDLCLYITKLKGFFSSTALFSPFNNPAQDLPAAEERLHVQNIGLPNSIRMV